MASDLSPIVSAKFMKAMEGKGFFVQAIEVKERVGALIGSKICIEVTVVRRITILLLCKLHRCHYQKCNGTSSEVHRLFFQAVPAIWHILDWICTHSQWLRAFSKLVQRSEAVK